MSSVPEPSPGRRFVGALVQFSGTGVVVAGLFFTFSLVPSLLPRGSFTQGVVSGITVVLGYGLGTLLQWTWDFLELPRPPARSRVVVATVAGVLVGIAIVFAVWHHIGWQNDVRALMGMNATTPLTWPIVAVVTVAVAAGLLWSGRAIRHLFRATVAFVGRRLPARLARVVATILIAVLAWGLWSGVLVSGFFAGANRVFAPQDQATDPGVEPPTSPLRSGSADSLVAWDSLGRQGRNFVALGPTVEQLADFHGGGTKEPIRVYAGLLSGETVQQRADLVLAELQRTGAFNREVLVIATTTGTGFLDEDGVDPLEWLHNGDTAIAGVQYSYLPSWISLLADQDIVREVSRTVFDTVHSHWSTLPPDSRPEIYLYGLSLGSDGVEAVLESIQVLNEPIDGALLVGPPFVSDLHARLTANRDPGSPAWLPVVDRGRTVRFSTRGMDPEGPDAPSSTWGDTRVLYLQYASDPVVFFSPDLAWQEPDWLEPGQRGPEVSEDVVWAPVVTMWQVLLDGLAAGFVPEGYGHLYSREDNARAWAAVTRPDDGWTDQDMQRLHALFAAQSGG